MLSLTPEAVAYIQEQNKPVYLDIPPTIGCCITIRESPAVRFGEPRDPENYDKRTIDGVTVFVPDELPDQPLTIVVSKFFGYKKLMVAGWHLA